MSSIFKKFIVTTIAFVVLIAPSVGQAITLEQLEQELISLTQL